MPAQSSVTINDFDGQSGTFAVNSTERTAANMVAQQDLFTDLYDSLPPIIDGISVSYGFSQRIQVAASNAKSGDPEAQRGNKWRVNAYDNTANLGAGVPNPYFRKPFQYEIPTANLELRVDNNNVVWIEGGVNNVTEFDGFVAAFEAYALSPVGGVLQVSSIEAITSSGG